jgi:hypothetical protein
MEVIQAKRVKAAPDITMSDDVILDDDEGYE